MSKIASIVAGCLCAALAACAGGTKRESVDAQSSAVSNVRVELGVPPGIFLDTVEVEISGDGFRSVVQLKVDEDGSVFSAMLSDIPVGASYQVRVLSSVTSDGQVCTASGAVDVEANTPNALSLSLLCVDASDLDAEAHDAGDKPESPAEGPGDQDADSASSMDAEAEQDSSAGGPLDAGADADAVASGCVNGACDDACTRFACGSVDLRVVQISAGDTHTCALLSNGQVLCWGSNSWGELGDRTMTDRPSPMFASQVSGAVAITTGNRHTCALLETGSVLCWGGNGHGQLGDGTSMDRGTRPVVVQGISDATGLSAGHFYTCARLRSGEVRCWGVNDIGELGDGTKTSRYSPVAVMGLGGAVAVAAFQSCACALIGNGEGRCWGAAGGGTLGNGKNYASYDMPPYLRGELTPVSVLGLQGAVQITGSSRRTCAVLGSGAVDCWGAPSFDYVPSDTTNLLLPTEVPGLSGVAEVAVSEDQVCMRLETGSVRCSPLNEESTSTLVEGLSDVVQLTAKTKHTCALLRSGEVRCWGDNSRGQLGDGTLVERLTPTAVVFPPFAGLEPGPESCRPLVVPDNGSVSYSAGTSVGSVATHACSDGFTPRPASLERTCRAGDSGPTWDGDSVRCMAAGCGDGVVSSSEDCDPDAPGESLWTCTSRCRVPPYYKRCTDGPHVAGCNGAQECRDGMCVPRCYDGLFKCPAPASGAPAYLVVQAVYGDTTPVGLCYVEGCTSYRDCPTGEICSSGRCVSCGSSSQCPAEMPICHNAGAAVSIGQDGACTALPSCTSYSDCASGLVCGAVGIENSVNSCRKCMSSAECPAELPYCQAYNNDWESCTK